MWPVASGSIQRGERVNGSDYSSYNKSHSDQHQVQVHINAHLSHGESLPEEREK